MKVSASIARPTSISTSEEKQQKFAATRLAISVAATLIIIKTLSGWYTESVSIFASLLDSTMDIFASTINFFVVRAAARPPDEDHAYGHGKAESLAGLFQSAVILVSAGFLIYEAVRRILAPQPTRHESIGIITMLVALGLSLFLVARLRHVARLTDSPALRAEAMHYVSDIYTTSSALVALIVTLITGWQLADPIASLIISVYIILFAMSGARNSIDVLMDRRLPESVDGVVERIINDYEARGVVGFHALKTRAAGSEKFIELHLEIDRSKTFVEAHALTVNVIRSIEQAVPRARVQIHADPSVE